MELPSIMASLTLDDAKDSPTHGKIEVKAEESRPSSLRKRSLLFNDTVEDNPPSRLRKRSFTVSSQSGCVAKKKCMMRNMKPPTEKEIKDLYLNKKVKLKRTNLETIFEEPKESDCGEQITMSTVKYKRTLNFSVTKSKKNKRKSMAKGIKARRKQQVQRLKKVSLADLMARITDTMNGDS